MTDPLDFDGLVEVGARAIPDLDRAQRFVIARAILSAVLPHVLAGPREALEPLAQVSSFFPERYYQPPDAVAELVRRGEYARLEVGHLRRAADELARIDKLTEGLGT